VFGAWHKHKVELEIIVNNDSNDISEQNCDGIPITYLYERSQNLSDIYRLLYDKATKEYLYYLEDDDIMSENFFEELSQYNEDVFYFNYIPHKMSHSFIKFFGYTTTHGTKTIAEFLSKYDSHHFQFCQICFKKKALDPNAFPTTNDLHNDYKIFSSLVGSFRAIPKCLYTQTTDGGDNISFKALNKDPRWIS